MRYWVYQDTRIVGPYAREEMASVSGLSPESLVCPEEAEGKKEADWRPLSHVPELLELVGGADLPPGPEGQAADAAFEAFRGDAHSALEEMGFTGEWISGALDDSRLSFSVDWLDQGYGADSRLEAERARTAELEEKLLELRAELERFERRQDEILERLNEKDRQLAQKNLELEDARKVAPPAISEPILPEPIREAAPPPVLEIPASEPVARAAPPVIIEDPLPPPPPPAQIPPNVPLPAPEAEPPVQKAASAPEPEAFTVAELLAQKETPPARSAPADPSLLAAIPESTPLKSVSGFPEVVDFVAPAPEEAPAPADLAPAEPAPAPVPEPAPVVEPSPASQEAPAVEASAPLDVQIQEAPGESSGPALSLEAPPPSSAEAPAEAPPEPMSLESVDKPRTMVFGEVQGSEEPAAAPPVMDPFPGVSQPAPAGSDIPLESLSLTPIPLSEPPMMMNPSELQGPKSEPPVGQPDLPATVIQGLGLRTPLPGTLTPTGGAGASASAGFSGASAAPIAVAPTGAPDVSGLPPKPKGRQKGFLIAMGAGLAGLVVIAVLFRRHPEQVVQMATMEPGRKGKAPAAVASPMSGPAPAAKSVFPGRPPEQASEPPPAQPAPRSAAPVVPAAPAAPAAPAPSRDFIEDHRIDALEFVKGYSLGPERGTIQQRLQDSFEIPGKEASWDAGSLPDNIYVVTYSVYQSGQVRRGNEQAKYIFEVDLNSKTLAGKNDDARRLLAGNPPQQQAPASRPAPAPRARSKPRPAKAVRRAPRPAPKPEAASPPSQLPLPEDSELASPAAPAKAPRFNNPGSDTLELNP